ncbi:DUF4149 domain-containing protein [Sulfurimonas microaerophilic]|uniref:DUF4149 domain-containing protein n=1 Tax=Sulfurimonas microaerophilic TaxID=3058392 RepID=UPI002714D7F9|nr:DUF4149 domain-containing protein [Sulfurimonas sp. hsl 1-7]
MIKRNIFLDFSYLLVIAASLGGVLALGALVAPVVFHTDTMLVGALLDNYNAGIIMGEIFRRFSYWIYFLAAYVFIYEALMYKQGQRDNIALISSFLTIATSLMFSAVYSPKILAMQALGTEATQSDTFQNIHIASEIDFKILAVSLLVLFIRRLMLLRIS